MIPPDAQCEFVAAMEDVLDVYSRPYSAEYPVVCADEQPRQLIAEKRVPIPPAPGRVGRVDYEYERRGTANIFLAVEPLIGQRTTEVTETRTRKDFARFLKRVVDSYPHAKKVIVMLDNLNIHTLGSLYETFPPEEARRLAQRMEIHYTPKHGSWLNMAEIEFSVLSRQCLDRRIPEREIMAREVSAWEQKRNAAKVLIDWQFKTPDARVKLKRLYPVTSTVAED